MTALMMRQCRRRGIGVRPPPSQHRHLGSTDVASGSPKQGPTSVYRDESSDKIAEQMRRVQRRQQETTEQCIGVCTAVGGWRRRLACRLSCSDRAGGARASRGLGIVPGRPTNDSHACPSRLFPRNSLLSNHLENYPNAVALTSQPPCAARLGTRPRYWSLPRRPPALSPPMLRSEEQRPHAQDLVHHVPSLANRSTVEMLSSSPVPKL